MNLLTLFAGLGGNRRLWGDEHHITAVELNPDIAAQYHRLYPNDTVIVGDAHQYLLDHHADGWNFIWSSPPCQSHSVAGCKGRNQSPRYVDPMLWQEIIFLQTFAECGWVVENVKSYYTEFLPSQAIGRHRFWANFHISCDYEAIPLFDSTREGLAEFLGFGYEGNIYYDENHDPLQVLRNCVHPRLGKAVLNSYTQPEQSNALQGSLL
jgi:DNA (cytosine-5)-methyltransferase 1